MKKLIFIFAMLLIACGGSGTLYSPPGLNYYDFNYDATKAQTVASLTSNTTTLTYNFVWDGVAGQNITTPQHAVVAMTQIASPTTTLNQTGQMIWTHGAGALVGERGLALELWFRNDLNGNGYTDDQANAVVWSQDNGRCATDVLQTIPDGQMCLAATDNPNGHITSAPYFQLKKGVAYVIKVQLIPLGSGWMKLRAELYQPTATGTGLVQSGSVNFQTASFFPSSSAMVNAAVARTPGEPSIQYTALP